MERLKSLREWQSISSTFYHASTKSLDDFDCPREANIGKLEAKESRIVDTRGYTNRIWVVKKVVDNEPSTWVWREVLPASVVPSQLNQITVGLDSGGTLCVCLGICFCFEC